MYKHRIVNQSSFFQAAALGLFAAIGASVLLGAFSNAAQARQEVTAELAQANNDPHPTLEPLVRYRLEPLPNGLGATTILEYEPPLSNERCIVVYGDDPATPALMHCVEQSGSGQTNPAPIATEDTQEPLTAYWLPEDAQGSRLLGVVEFRPRTLLILPH